MTNKIRLFVWLCLVVFAINIFLGIWRHIPSLPVSGRLILRENRGTALGEGGYEGLALSLRQEYGKYVL